LAKPSLRERAPAAIILFRVGWSTIARLAKDSTADFRIDPRGHLKQRERFVVPARWKELAQGFGDLAGSPVCFRRGICLVDRERASQRCLGFAGLPSASGSGQVGALRALSDRSDRDRFLFALVPSNSGRRLDGSAGASNFDLPAEGRRAACALRAVQDGCPLCRYDPMICETQLRADDDLRHVGTRRRCARRWRRDANDFWQSARPAILRGHLTQRRVGSWQVRQVSAPPLLRNKRPGSDKRPDARPPLSVQSLSAPCGGTCRKLIQRRGAEALGFRIISGTARMRVCGAGAMARLAVNAGFAGLDAIAGRR